MKKKLQNTYLTLFCGLIGSVSFSQVDLPKTPTPATFQVITPTQNVVDPTKNIVPNPMGSLYDDGQDKIRQRNRQMIEQDLRNGQLQKHMRNEMNSDIAEFNATRLNFSLPSYGNAKGAKMYYETFERMKTIDPNGFSIKDVNFMIEDTFFEGQLDKEEFDEIIKNIGAFLFAKMDELGYDPNSNSAKNFMIFQFFSEKLRLKDGTEHLPFEYDFDDYMGRDDYSKMFVSKLLRTQTGQCHSMPLLYLIVAEEIGAEAYLAYSPNHSYIRFPADNGKWYEVELTNGMFSTQSYILNSGFIKSEALQNKIYMQNLSKRQLLAQHFTDLANGYVHKYGYDEFVATAINKALELYPNHIGANLTKANIDAVRLEYMTNKLGIDPNVEEERNKIRQYPMAIAVLHEAQNQFQKVDDLGYTHMPDEAYQNWLQTMREQKNKTESQRIKEQFKGLSKQKTVKN